MQLLPVVNCTYAGCAPRRHAHSRGNSPGIIGSAGQLAQAIHSLSRLMLSALTDSLHAGASSYQAGAQDSAAAAWSQLQGSKEASAQ